MVIFSSLIISLFIFLFSFYIYTKDDLFFIRKGVTMEQLFNILFIGLLWGVFFARLFYIILNLKFQYLSPIRFLLFTYYPGVSIFGGILGIVIGYAWLTKRRKIPRARFTDYISVALLAMFPLFFLGVFSNAYLFIMYAVIFLLFANVLLPKYNKGLLKEGSISYIFLVMVSLISILQDVFLLYTENVLLPRETFLFTGLFIISTALLVRLETGKRLKSS